MTQNPSRDPRFPPEALDEESLLTPDTRPLSPVELPTNDTLIVSNSPHIRGTETVPQIMSRVIYALLPACAAGVYFFGFSALRVLTLSVFFCLGVEWICRKMAGRNTDTWKDGSAILTGLLLGMNLSASVPWWICLVGAILAIGLGKQVFGGLGYNPFNPALVARVGLLIGFPQIMTTWAVPTLGKMSHVDVLSGATPLGLSVEQVAASDGLLHNLFCGNVGGCIGETSAVALLIGGLMLMFWRLIKWEIPLGFIGVVAALTTVVNYYWPELSPPPLFHIFAGGLLLGAFFMATDMVTSPVTGRGALVFGMGCGLITSVIRIWGSYPEGVSFSILIMNALTPLIDRGITRKPFGFRKEKKA